MNEKDVLDYIIEYSNEWADIDMPVDVCIEYACDYLAKKAKRKAFVDGALAAGIPLSVIEGKTKLSDHFSKEYIASQCNKFNGGKNG